LNGHGVGVISNIADNKWEIRLLKKNDPSFDSLFRIDHEAFGENSISIWTLLTYIQYGKVFGLFVQDELKGFIIFMRAWDDPQLAYLKKVAIDKESCGKGYASYLISKTLSIIKKDGISNVVLTVAPNNLSAMHIYHEKLGFELEEYRENEYGPGRDRWFMRLRLMNWREE
jgi:[ribosomal protein S18]-alanine N-acetyltransferase